MSILRPPGAWEHTTFLSNISYNVTKECLMDLLIQISPIRNIQYKSKIAFVEYYTRKDQLESFERLNLIRVYQRRILFTIVEQRVHVSVCCTLSVDAQYMKDVFSKFGSCKVKGKESKFTVIFRKESSANEACKAMNGKTVLNNTFHLKVIGPDS